MEEKRRAFSAQLAPKIAKGASEGGRPEFSINAAAREIGIERKKAQRAIKIDGMAPETNEEAARLRLGNKRWLADEHRSGERSRRNRSIPVASRTGTLHRQPPPTSA